MFSVYPKAKKKCNHNRVLIPKSTFGVILLLNQFNLSTTLDLNKQ